MTKPNDAHSHEPAGAPQDDPKPSGRAAGRDDSAELTDEELSSIAGGTGVPVSGPRMPEKDPASE